MDIKQRIWKQFVETGDPGLYMLYKAFDEGHKDKNGGGENPWLSLRKEHRL